MTGSGGARTTAWVAVGVAVAGLAAATCGYLLLTTWEVAEAGRLCGAPLDNPGWRTGVPCHGAVNRQTAVGWMVLAMGIGLVGGAVVFTLARYLDRSRAGE